MHGPLWRSISAGDFAQVYRYLTQISALCSLYECTILIMAYQDSKKRSAPSSAGPSKKPFNKPFNKNSSNQANGKPRSFAGKPASKGKQPARAEEDVEKHRKRPITQSAPVNDDGDDEDVDMSSEEAGGEGASGQNGAVDGEEAVKRPRMTKTEKAALHAAQPHRTALLPSHPLLQDKLLPLWETARRADLGKEERKKAVNELWESVKGRVAEVSRGHKGGRVLQTVGVAHVER